MEDSVKNRLIAFIAFRGLSKNRFEEICGLSKRYVSNISRSIQPDKIKRISLQFPDLNTGWLLTGEGRMLNGPYERINQILELEGLTQEEFAKGTGDFGFLFPSIYKKAQKNPGDPDVLKLWVDALLRRFPYYSREWIMTGQGEMRTDTVKAFPLKTDRQVEDQYIPLYDLAATAGLVEIYNDLRPDPVDHLRIPNLPPVDGAVYVRGDSMSPLLKSGDIIIFKKVELSPDLILWGQIYLLSYTAGGDTYTVVKYVKRSSREGCIQLVSANTFYDPMDIPASSITALALVKASITFYTME